MTLANINDVYGILEYQEYTKKDGSFEKQRHRKGGREGGTTG